jgi:hypothetical protein
VFLKATIGSRDYDKIDKELENGEYFSCLGSMMTNEARCTCEIKQNTAMAKAAFNRKKILFSNKLD